jgi:hypothetical protein
MYADAICSESRNFELSPSQRSPQMLRYARLSLKSKQHDAPIDENGETAATSNRGVTAADSLVAVKCVKVSALLTDASLEREAHRCKARMEQFAVLLLFLWMRKVLYN